MTLASGSSRCGLRWECDQPRTVLSWVRNSHSARLLADLAAAERTPTHEALDGVARDVGRGDTQTIDYLRGILVTYQVLPERDELVAHIERHLARTVKRHPEHALLLSSYVRWSLLPRARKASPRPAGSNHRIRWAYTRINTAVAFLTAMREQGLGLADVTQHQIDAWLAGAPSTRYEVRDFVVWAARRGHSHSHPLLVPHRPKKDPVGLDEDSHWELLHQCLTDTALPLDVRAAGAVLLLFGQQLARIASDAPPPSGWAANSPRHWLFPGTRPGQHLSAAALARRLAAHHIPIRPARTTVLVQLAGDLPPAVLAPLLGLHAVTAERRAATDWTAYLEARMFTRDGGAPVLAAVNRKAALPTIE
ncbi:hypothetical protein ACFU8W_48670 [Streptomyces sp. NPDC057565]|uniref:hypothetical protein n=1 Tax=Streptomyces sp. NPDC057565 TaxID=3346169 RepID=UPI0036C8D875